MAAASRVLATSLGPDGQVATLTLNYDDVTLLVANITLNNPSSANCIVHVVNKNGKTKFDQAFGTGSTILDLTGAITTLTTDLTFPSGWEIGMGF